MTAEWTLTAAAFALGVEAPTEMFDDGDWKSHGACRGAVENSLFFPERGEGSTEAKATCATCPVRVQCLVYAMNSGEKFGIWGGLSERQRRGLRVGRRVELGDNLRGPIRRERPISHGGTYGYQQHRDRNEPACDACKAANTTATAKYRGTRGATATAAFHGDVIPLVRPPAPDIAPPVEIPKPPQREQQPAAAL